MTKTFIRFFTVADYEEEEKWLRAQHAAGWRLVRMLPPCFYVFERCEPADVVYRLDFRCGLQTPEYMQLLTDYGWEQCGQCFGWLYFRRSAEDVPEEETELFSDDASRVQLVQKVARRRLIPLTVISCAASCPVACAPQRANSAIPSSLGSMSYCLCCTCS